LIDETPRTKEQIKVDIGIQEREQKKISLFLCVVFMSYALAVVPCSVFSAVPVVLVVFSVCCVFPADLFNGPKN